MKRTVSVLVLSVLVLVATGAAAFEMTPATQKQIEQQVEVARQWAEDPVIVKAVMAQNDKGPIADMDNAKWKTVRRSDALVKGFQANEAGQFLKRKVAGSGDMISEAFLSVARGEKVAFVEETTSYIHKGSAKFDVPYGTGKSWQGKPEFGESAQTHQVQVSVPVLSDGKPVGVLVLGVNLTKAAKVAQN